VIGDGNGAFASAVVMVTVEGPPAPPVGRCTDALAATLARSRVHFNQNGTPDYAVFAGSMVLTEGNLAPDFRTANAALGTLTVTFGTNNPVVAYQNNNLVYTVSSGDPTDNREAWMFAASHKEKMTVQWRETQVYDANRDPNLPVRCGRLFTEFIHVDETEFRFDFKKATLPVTVVVDGIVLVTVDAAGNVSSALPHSARGKTVDVVFPDRLVPGNTIAWYADGDASNGVTGMVFSHDATADGSAVATYYNAGGRFWITVPIAGITKAYAQKTAKVEMSFGEQHVTLVGCGEFTAPVYRDAGNNWQYWEHRDRHYYDNDDLDWNDWCR
jgi:hypothetical protein